MVSRKVFTGGYLFLIIFLFGMKLSYGQYFAKESRTYIKEEITPNLTINEGFLSRQEQGVDVIRDGNVVAKIQLSSPVILSTATQKEPWGFYQFPTIFRRDNGDLIVQWSMNDDAVSAYGRERSGALMSRDEGDTWEEVVGSIFSRGRRRLEYPNGNVLRQSTPTAVHLSNYPAFPKPVCEESINERLFYFEKDLPDDLRGMYFTLWDKGSGKAVFFHGTVDDPQLLRCSVSGKMPVVWWVDMRILCDSTLVAGVYGGYYLNSKGKPLRSSVSFYKSTIQGHHWQLIGKIPYQPIGNKAYEEWVYDGQDGFTEPAFEVLNNGRFLCVMRSGDTTPLYKSFSDDEGRTWTKPEPFTPNGVMPMLLKLDNGVLVLASGRPGMQLRFNLNGDGEVWTEPIEMLPYTTKEGNFNEWWTCGYPSLLKASENTFYIVYSDFRTLNEKGEYRKSIVFRKVEVTLTNR